MPRHRVPRVPFNAIKLSHKNLDVIEILFSIAITNQIVVRESRTCRVIGGTHLNTCSRYLDIFNSKRGLLGGPKKCILTRLPHTVSLQTVSL